MIAGLLVRGLLDIGGVCFGLSVIVRRERDEMRWSSLHVAGCLCFGAAGLIDLFRAW